MPIFVNASAAFAQAGVCTCRVWGEESEQEHNQRRWLNQLDTLIKKAAGDISSHLCPLVCVHVSVCSVYACVCVQKCQWAIRQLVVCAGGHLRASQRTPPPTLSESHSVLPWCAHWRSQPPLYSLSVSHLLCFFVYVTRCTFISTSVIILLSHCR